MRLSSGTKVLTKMIKWSVMILSLFLVMSYTIEPMETYTQSFVYDRPIDYKEMTRRLEYFAERFPDLVELESFGRSPDNRRLWLVRLGKGETKLHINASVHARERITTNIILKNIEEYTAAYESDDPWIEGYNVRELLDEVTIYIVPMANPDGVDYTIYGKHGIHGDTLRDNLEGFVQTEISPFFRRGLMQWKSNARGVDLNRQFPYAWHNELNFDPGRPASAMYKGDTYLSEPEAQALYDLQLSHPFMVNAAYHTQGEVIFWYPPSDWFVRGKNRNLVDHIVELTGFESVPVFTPGGGFTDWSIGGLNIPSVTMEFGKGPYSDKDFEEIYKPGRALPLLLAEKAIMYEASAPFEVRIDGRTVKKFDFQYQAEAFIEHYHSDTIAEVELINRHSDDILFARDPWSLQIQFNSRRSISGFVLSMLPIIQRST